MAVSPAQPTAIYGKLNSVQFLLEENEKEEKVRKTKGKEMKRS
jgi:hypothetical protein